MISWVSLAVMPSVLAIEDSYLDLFIDGTFLRVKLVVVVWVHLEVVESKFLLDPFLEGHALFICEGIRFGNDGNDIHDVRKLL